MSPGHLRLLIQLLLKAGPKIQLNLLKILRALMEIQLPVILFDKAIDNSIMDDQVESGKLAKMFDGSFAQLMIKHAVILRSSNDNVKVYQQNLFAVSK